MADENESTKPVDPFATLRGMRDNYLDAMSKVMMNAVNSEEYAQATGNMLNSALVASVPFREALDKAMAVALQQSSMPSRQEVAALAGRFTNIEMRLDDMEAKLDRIVELCSAARPKPASANPKAEPTAKTEAKRKAGAKQSRRQSRSRKKG
jgi:hypothetical protein